MLPFCTAIGLIKLIGAFIRLSLQPILHRLMKFFQLICVKKSE